MTKYTFFICLEALALVTSCKDSKIVNVPPSEQRETKAVQKVPVIKKLKGEAIQIKDNRGRIIGVGREEGSKIIYRDLQGKILFQKSK